MRPTIFAAAAVLVVTAATPLAAAPLRATPVRAEGVNDPFEKLNRAGFAIEGVLERWVVGPLSHIYRALTPGPIGQGIHNLVTNLTEPMTAMNGVFQLRPKRAGAAIVRFAFNSTFGLAGLIDVAAKGGIPHRANSFGDTLGRYGIGSGPYLFFPLVGPSSVRDMLGTVVDIVIDPVHLVNYPYRSEVSIGSGVAGGLDLAVHSEGDLKALLSDAADPYATLRSTYLQARQAEIKGEGAAPLDLPDLDQPTLAPAPNRSSPPGDGSTPSGPTSSITHPGAYLLASANDQATSFQALPHQ